MSLWAVLDTRAFSSIWYWLLLAGIWSWLGRGALGIPSDLLRELRRMPAGSQAHERATHELLTWISLVTPRWRVAPRDGLVLIAGGSCAVSALATAGFLFGAPLAQALALLIGPLLLLALMRVRLAARLAASLRGAQSGQVPPAAAAADAASALMMHQRATMMLSIVAVAGSAIWGMLWLARHPFGL